MRKRPEVIEIDTDGGSLYGVVHHDPSYLMNWAQSERLDEASQDVLRHLQMPVAILKNVNVDEDRRGEGIGNDLVSSFLDQVDSQSVGGSASCHGTRASASR